jgi:O-antigen/teichoic acid export membrane protein
MKETTNEKLSQLTTRFFKNASLYGIGMIIVRMGGFIAMPLYWRVLTPADFGLIELVLVFSQVYG